MEGVAPCWTKGSLQKPWTRVNGTKNHTHTECNFRHFFCENGDTSNLANYAREYSGPSCQISHIFSKASLMEVSLNVARRSALEVGGVKLRWPISR